MPIVPQGRVCTHCKVWKPASEFKRVSGQPHKLRPWCNPCAVDAERRRRSKIVMRVCKACGTEYQCRNAESRYCDPCGTTRRYANLEQGEAMRLVCNWCGVVFPSESSRRKYCSRKCKGDAAKGVGLPSKGKERPHTRRAAIRICPGCGKEFRGIKDTKRKKQHYCSHNCYLRCRHISHFENSVIGMLETAGLTIERQAKRGRWSFDGAVVGTRILVEADGVYWHSFAIAKARDARKSRWAAQHGYVLVRVPELDFRADPVKAIAPILRRAEAEGLTVERVEQ